jgi:phage tail-like protein
MSDTSTTDSSTSAQGANGASPGVFVDPLVGFNFTLIIPGIADAHFTECTGLGARVTPITYREGGTTQPHRIPGPLEFADLTLRYGLTSSRQLWDWFVTGMNGKVRRQNLSLVVLDPDGATPRVQWDLVRAWVSEWRAAPLDAMCSEIAIETLVIVYEDLKRV